jgi:hypothetical protein
MEVMTAFITDPYSLGLLIVGVVLIYLLKGDVDFMPPPIKKDSWNKQ